MKILVPTTKLQDIGDLDFAKRFPMAIRKSSGMTTICKHCGQSIDDDYFIAGCKAGMPNMMFHESCVE